MAVITETVSPVRPSAFDAFDPPEADKYRACVHCGLCLPTCPTHVVLGEEMDSPRGRIYLIRAADEGRIGITDTFVKHMNLCLVCRACETACPSGVQFGAIMETARGQMDRHYRYPRGERWFRDFILGAFTSVERTAWLLRPLRWYQRLGMQRLVRASGVLRLLGRLGEMERLLPEIPDLALRNALPAETPAEGVRRGRVGLMVGCVNRVMFPYVNAASVRVLPVAGYEVVIPKAHRCCGSLMVHEGERERGRAFARQTIDEFEPAGVDFIAVNAAGCGSVMKEYGELLRSDPAYAERARVCAGKVRDITQLLVDTPLDGRLRPLPLTVTYHDACHLAHGQRVRQEPRKLLQAIPELRLVELKESDFCCGSAGVYNLLHPKEAKVFLDRKLERVAETNAEIVVSGNPGCTLQIQAGLRGRGKDVRVLHPAELVDWSLRGGLAAPSPWELGR